MRGPRALQVALLVPILAALVGLLTSFRMMRLPDPKPSSSADGMLLGLTFLTLRLPVPSRCRPPQPRWTPRPAEPQQMVASQPARAAKAS